MITKSLLIAALAGLALSSSALAYSPNDTARTPASAVPRPVPASVVQPTGLPLKFADAVINIEFSLDPAGQPRDIKVLRVDDPVLKRQLVAAFKQWRFESAPNAPVASDRRFILPVHLKPEV
jgi:hypothetical protein